jgi:hypothetical protein
MFVCMYVCMYVCVCVWNLVKKWFTAQTEPAKRSQICTKTTRIYSITHHHYSLVFTTMLFCFVETHTAKHVSVRVPKPNGESFATGVSCLWFIIFANNPKQQKKNQKFSDRRLVQWVAARWRRIQVGYGHRLRRLHTQDIENT